MSYHNRTLEEITQQFLDKVNKTDTCWLWTGNKRRGYGTVTIRGRCRQASKVAWLLFVKKVKSADELCHEYAALGKLEACHKCNNLLCVWGEHLYIATHQDNLWESVLSGKGIKLSAQEVVEIRDLYATGHYTTRELGNIYGVSQSQTHRIINFVRRKHLNLK